MLKEFADLKASIQDRLDRHHVLYPGIKVKDYLWEHAVHAAFANTCPYLAPEWNYGSQQIGKDITLANGVEISCKSGAIHSDERIKISSSRLSRLRNYEKIKTYLCESKNDDYIICLSTEKADKKRPHFDGRYLYSVFRSDVFNYQNMQWEFFGKDSNLRGHSPEGVTVTCTEAMGYQVWYFLPKRLALYSTEIICNV